MTLRNTESGFGWAAKGLHWLTALAIAAMFAIAWWMDELPIGLAKLQAYGWHKSLGMTILAVTVLRLVWRLANPQPKFLGPAGWQRLASQAAHGALYACLIAMPILGWLMSAAANTPVNVFGLVVLPNPIGADKALAELLAEAHETVGTVLLVLIGLHAAAALKHHLVDRDATLRRMLPVLVLMAMLFPFAASAEAPAWRLDPERSRITFTFTQLGSPIEGAFRAFEADIRFDPTVPTGTIAVTIDTASLDTGDDNRDTEAWGPAFFAVSDHPQATFRSETVTGTNGSFAAVGTLSLKGVTKPLTLPFTLEVDGARARAAGSVTVNRQDFAIGTGEWLSNGAIGDAVVITIDVTATRAP